LHNNIMLLSVIVSLQRP